MCIASLCADVAARLLASLLNPYSGHVRLAAQATLQHVTLAAPRARVWLLQILSAAQALLMGAQPQVTLVQVFHNQLNQQSPK